MELSEDALDVVWGGYPGDYETNLKVQLDLCDKKLVDPKISSDDRLAIYREMERLQEELDKYMNNNQLGGRSR